MTLVSQDHVRSRDILKTLISPHPQGVCPPKIPGWSLMVRGTHLQGDTTFDHVVMWGGEGFRSGNILDLSHDYQIKESCEKFGGSKVW